MSDDEPIFDDEGKWRRRNAYHTMVIALALLFIALLEAWRFFSPGSSEPAAPSPESLARDVQLQYYLLKTRTLEEQAHQWEASLHACTEDKDRAEDEAARMQRYESEASRLRIEMARAREDCAERVLRTTQQWGAWQVPPGK